MLRNILTCVCVALFVSSVTAQTPEPIRLWLSPAKPPTPALRYQLLPDARITISGDAAALYKEAIDRLKKTSYQGKLDQFIAWRMLPIDELPKKEVRKALAEFDEVFAALDGAARCDHCEWGHLERLRDKGLTDVREVAAVRDCRSLLQVRAKLAIADGCFDKAIVGLRTSFAMSRHIGETESGVCLLVGTTFASTTEQQIGDLIGQPNAPNLYYALTDLPTPLISTRKWLESERFELSWRFPGLHQIAMNLDAGNMTPQQIQDSVKVLDTFPFVGLGEDKPRTDKERHLLARLILDKHEIAKQALIAAGRPRDRVEAMPHFQVALLHGLLERDAILDEMLVWSKLPYWEQAERLNRMQRAYMEDRANNPKAAALPLATQQLVVIQTVTAACIRANRRLAVLRTIEAIRFYAATHDGKLPPTLAAIKEVPIPFDPMTGKPFDYQLEGETATLCTPTPAKESPRDLNTVVYELRIRK